MPGTHHYSLTVTWTGNTGTGTSGYRDYQRQHEIAAAGKPPIAGSSDRVFHGDSSRWNPEELLVAALSACHQLSYLHVCADAGIVVLEYVDHAEGTMAQAPNGGGRFQSVTLRPRVTVAAGADLTLARDLHHSAHAKCFIASSVNFPVEVEPEIVEQR
jgi:organic hydroperoxide reductase OsmC/OhrA